MLQLSLFFILIPILVIKALLVLYEKIVDTYFVINGVISYKLYLYLIQIVSENNYFMNYGLWSKDTTTLKDANENLVQFLFEKSVSSDSPLKILDVGCGYGEQDKLLSTMLHPESTITAIDISEPQIFFAKKAYNLPNVKFEVGNALELDNVYNKQEFDRIYSIESAFHYKDRSKFLKAAHTVLKNDGTFIISDITLSDSYKETFASKVFLKLFSDFLAFPLENAISSLNWKESLEKHFEIIEYIDITEHTFLPYYNHFFHEFMKNKYLPSFIADILYNAFENVQPFAYNIAICKPKILK